MATVKFELTVQGFLHLLHTLKLKKSDPPPYARLNITWIGKAYGVLTHSRELACSNAWTPIKLSLVFFLFETEYNV